VTSSSSSEWWEDLETAAVFAVVDEQNEKSTRLSFKHLYEEKFTHQEVLQTTNQYNNKYINKFITYLLSYLNNFQLSYINLYLGKYYKMQKPKIDDPRVNPQFSTNFHKMFVDRYSQIHIIRTCAIFFY